MFPASTKGGGQLFGFPDVCLTPAPPAPNPVPIPYPNIGMVTQASKTASKVKICNSPVVTQKSELPRSMGDEAGVNKGVVSGMNMGKCTWKKGSMKVKVEGAFIMYLSSMTAHNGMNANFPPGMQVAPSQVKVIILS